MTASHRPTEAPVTFTGQLGMLLDRHDAAIWETTKAMLLAGTWREWKAHKARHTHQPTPDKDQP